MTLRRLIWLAMVLLPATAATAAGPCGDSPVCPPEYPGSAQSLQNLYGSTATSPSQRDKMMAIVADHTKDARTDWDNAEKAYRAWRDGQPTPPPVGDYARPRATASDGTPLFRTLRRAAEAHIRGRLIDPQSAQFEWPYGFIQSEWKRLFQKRVAGWITCGFVNSRNRMGGYVGRTAFVVVMDSDGAIKHSELGSNQDLDLTAMACQKSAVNLPRAPAEMFDPAEPAPQQVAAPVSVADELAKLAKLRDDGILSQAEFDAQKARLLQR